MRASMPLFPKLFLLRRPTAGEVEVILFGISEEVTEIELCVINRLRKRVVSFQTIEDFTATADTTFMEVGTIDVSMYHTIQQQVFDKTCTACHGGSAKPAAELNLLTGESYEDLVNQPSTIVNDVLRVKPRQCQRKHFTPDIEYEYQFKLGDRPFTDGHFIQHPDTD